MDFEKLLNSIESLLYLIIVEISLVFITVGKLFKHSKNCYAIVEAEEAIGDPNQQYRRYSSPIKLGVLIALATLFVINTAPEYTESESSEMASANQVIDSARTSTQENIIQNSDRDTTKSEVTETSSDNTHAANTDNTNNSKASTKPKEVQVYGVGVFETLLNHFTELKIYEQAAIFFVICNMNAIIIALLLFKISNEPILGKVFRGSFLAMIYARVYMTVPFLLLMTTVMYSPDTAFDETNGSLIIQLIFMLLLFLFAFGFYRYLSASLYIVKSTLGGISFFRLFGFLLLLILLDFWWIYFGFIAS